MIKVLQIPILKDNYSYIITEDESGLVACVDPSNSCEIINFLDKNNLDLDLILSTHHHHDHVGGNLELKKKYNCKIIGNFDDQKRIPGIDIPLKEDETYEFGDSRFKTIDTPGHTVGHISFYFEREEYLFCGDTIFSLGCGRIFEGTYDQMVQSILKIKCLPKKTKIFCGHEYTKSNAEFAIHLCPNNQLLKKKVNEIRKKREKFIPTVPTLLEDEIKYNPFMNFDNPEYLKSIGFENISNIENFKKIRLLKDNF